MFSKIRGIVFLAIILGLIGLFQIGCNRDSGENPFAAPISGSGSAINNANVSFKLVFPQKDSGTQSANILPAMDEPAVVNFQIKLLNYGNTSNPFFIISKQVPVVNGSASAIFESLPTTTILGQIHIENGKIQGYSDFHGALDLIQGENTVALAPVGSLMPQDVVAKALNEIISSSTLFLNAPQSLVSELDKIVSALLLDSSVAYDEVINNFNNRNGLPLVEIISPTTDQSFVTGDNISIVASATDLDGVISKIEFFHGSEKIGEAQAIPFSCSWKPLSEGTYTLTAKAFDNNSAVGVASPVFIKVVSKVVPVTYTVTYNGNGHTGGSVPSDTNSYEQNSTVTVRSNAGGLVKTGYTFMGWNTQPDGKGVSYSGGDIFQVLSANVTLYAIWNQDPTFTVTYDGNGHTGGIIPIDNLLYQQNATVSVKENIGSLVKNGYTFAGWNTSVDGSGTNYTPAATFKMVSNNVTLYAKWSLVTTYTVTYDGNGNTGGSVPTDNLTYQQNETVTVKDNANGLVKTGYTFAGWNTATDGSGTNINSGANFAMGAEDIILYAKWQFSAYSWSLGNVAVNEINFALGRPTAIYLGSSFSSPNAVDGSAMSRWESNRNDPGPDETNPHFLIVDLQQIREVRNIKVNIAGWDSWKQNFSIFTSTDLQSWSLLVSEQGKTGIFSYNIQPISIRYVKFSSTYSADDCQVNLYELEVYGTEQLIDTYTVTYNGNGNSGGAVPIDDQAYQQNATVTVKGNAGSLEKTGYTFAGWNTASDGSGESYGPATTLTIGSNNVTLYAKWLLIPNYTVTYNGNGNTSGVVPNDNLTYQQGATVTVKDNSGSFAKSGFKFIGWNTSADGSGTSYNPDSTFFMGTENITLYAFWSPCSIAISWVYQVGSNEDDCGNRIAFDKNNNILFSGYTEGVFDGISPANERDIFIKSVSQDGVGGWVKSPVKENSRWWGINGFSITDDTNFLITQSMYEWKNLSKIDNSGNILWMKNFSSDFVVVPQAIVSRGEFIYVTGYTDGALDGMTTPNGGSDVFIAKLTSLGEIIWLKQFGSEYGWESGVDISLDGAGNVFVSGTTNGCIDGTTTPVGNNVFLSKFDNAGTMCWVKQIPSSEHAIGHKNDEFDNIFIVAAYGHILKFNTNGDLVFHKTFSSGSPHSVYAMDLKGENIFIVGGSDTSVTGITNANPNSYNISGYWLKTDGSFVAELFYGTAAPDMAEDVVFYDNNTVFITGNTYGSLAGNANSGLGDAFLMKVKLNE
jgi:uncharacterized repeat protein (TIGR02543 family)